MKRLVIFSLFTFTTAVAAQCAVSLLGGAASVKNLEVERVDSALSVAMDIDINSLKLKSEKSVTLTPALRDSSNHYFRLPSVTVAGRNSYIRALRSGNDDMLFRSGKTSTLAYAVSTPLKQWMTNAQLVIEEDMCGCSCTPLMSATEMVSSLSLVDEPEVLPQFVPMWLYVSPAAEVVKTREVNGKAFIDFPVNVTEIRSAYRNNSVELSKIRATIDQVRNDKDVIITSVSIKGFASPEGGYKTNEQLAKGRTLSLAGYVKQLYAFSNDMVNTSWEAEDWAGLIDWLQSSSLPHKSEILAIIDNPVYEPDAREWKIKSTYPDEYKLMLTTVYPGLRHSDYAVNFTVKSYTEVSEIKQIYRTSPAKLSLQELFKLGQSMTPGSDDYNEVFELAVRLYPDNAVANLNAGVNALRNGNTERAASLLKKAGDLPESLYARGILAALTDDCASAAVWLKAAQAAGVKEASDAMKQLKEMKLIP